MTKAVTLFAVVLLFSGLAGCASNTSAAPSIANQSIAQKFAAFAKNGWAVTGGGIPNPMLAQQPLPQNAVYPAGQSPFSHPIWSTNFHIDPATSGAANVVTPASNNGLFSRLFQPASPNVVGQPGQSSVSR